MRNIQLDFVFTTAVNEWLCLIQQNAKIRVQNLEQAAAALGCEYIEEKRTKKLA